MSRILLIAFVLLASSLSVQPLIAQQKVKVGSKEEAEKLKKEQEKANKSKELVNSGNSLFRTRDYNSAVKKYDEAIKLDPSLGKAYYYRGMALKKLKKFDDAEKSLMKATDLMSDEAGPYYQLGGLYEDIGKNTEAVNFYNLSVQKEPNYVKSYYALGNLYVNAYKNNVKAIEMFNRAIEYDPKYDLAYYGLGKTLAKEKRYSQAIDAFQKALNNTSSRDRKNKARYNYELAEAYQADGKLTKAISIYDECLKYATNAFFKGGAYFGLGETYNKLSKKSKALENYKKAKGFASWRSSADYKIKKLTGKL